jgi:hypothetical protein
VALIAAMCCIAPVLVASPAAAQSADEPPLLFLDISTGISFEDRRDADDQTEVLTQLGLGYFTSTYNQRLSFETGITARGLNSGGAWDAGLINPFATLTYARFNRDHEIGVDLAYRQSQVETDALDDDFDANDLGRQEGVREDVDLGLSLVTGRAAPFGTETRLRYRTVNYGDGATNEDTETRTIDSRLRFTVDPRIELTLRGFWNQQETDDAVNTVETTHRVTFGAALAIDRAWSANLGVGFAEIETETTGGVVSQDGLEGSFLLTRDLPNGALSFSSDHVVTDAGWRNSVRVRRTVEMANGDRFDASIGQIFFEEGQSGHLASLEFSRIVRRGAVNVGFNYSSDLDDTDLLVQRTRLEASLRQDLTDASGWSIDGALARVDYDNPATDDAMRFDVGLAYLYALSNDWTLAAEVEHQVLYENGAIEDTTNVFSLNLQRRFSVRP